MSWDQKLVYSSDAIFELMKQFMKHLPPVLFISGLWAMQHNIYWMDMSRMRAIEAAQFL